MDVSEYADLIMIQIRAERPGAAALPADQPNYYLASVAVPARLQAAVCLEVARRLREEEGEQGS